MLISRNNNLCILILLLFCSSCGLLNKTKVGKEYTRKSGLKYTVTDQGHGEMPEKGQKLKVHYKCYFENGDVFYDTRGAGMPFVFQLGYGQVIKGWDEGMSLFREGTKATLIVPSNLAYGERGFAKIPPNTVMYYDMEFISIIDPPIPFDVFGMDTLVMESGLKIIKVRQTDGKKVKSFKHVRVEYTGYLENGNIFDSSLNRGMPFSFEVGKGQVISGWDEAFTKLRLGEKARIIVPPSLAYGEKGMPPSIPGGATLIFDLEVLEMY